MPARLCPVSTGQSIGFFNVQPWSRIPREVHVSKRDHLAGSDGADILDRAGTDPSNARRAVGGEEANNDHTDNDRNGGHQSDE
jgi:hypothetical protein